MEELVKVLEEENSDTRSYLQLINELSDDEIVSLFESTCISDSIKDKLFIEASEKINSLSTKNFIYVSRWATDVKSYKENYFERIEKITYEELVDLIYNGIYEPKIALEVMKTNIYQKYLEQEKVEQKCDDLQCVDILVKLDTASNMQKDLETIGLEIIKLEMQSTINKDYKKSGNLKYIKESYLDKVVENIDDFDLENKIIKICLVFMNFQIQNNQILTNKMIEFYLHMRLKELNLKDVCENVVVTLGESNCLGTATLHDEILNGGTIKIYSEYLPSLLRKHNLNMDTKTFNFNINLMSLQMLSHELGHIKIRKKYFTLSDNQTELDWFQSCYTNKWKNYLYRGSQLHNVIGDKGYNEHHSIFIEEVWCDIFSFFDANRQLLTTFKSSYSSEDLANIVCNYAKRIVLFYTNDDGKMLSPMEKFDMFYKENVEEKEQIPIVHELNRDIMDSLITGDKIPIDVYEFLNKIARKEILTTDLYQTLVEYIEKRIDLSTTSLENDVKEQQNLAL